MTEHIDWRTKQPSQVACVTSRKILNVEELETLLASTEPRAFHTTSRPEEKRRRKMQRRSRSSQKGRESYRIQSFRPG